jgi:hypothetical protein
LRLVSRRGIGVYGIGIANGAFGSQVVDGFGVVAFGVLWICFEGLI